MSDRTHTARQKAERRGRRAEVIASLLLQFKGYRVLARRARTPVGELDLVVRRGRTIAFIEVKQRATIDAAAYALTPAQAKRSARAAEWWLAKQGDFAHDSLRFDCVLVGRWSIRHIVNAFDAAGRPI